jgi:hypothetical protein
MAGVDKEILQRSWIHVPYRSRYILRWIDTILHIPAERVISDPFIQAKTLYVPEMGMCGRPTLSQMQWLRQRANLTADSHTTNTRAIQDKLTGLDRGKAKKWTSPLYTDVFTKEEGATSSSDKKTKRKSKPNVDAAKMNILLIQRSGARAVRNSHSVTDWLQTLKTVNPAINVYTHTERAMPSLAEQIAIFSNAHIIIAPHGAGLLFSVFASEHACVIELMFPGYPTCYARMAYLRRQDYMMSMVNEDHTINIQTIQESVMKCLSKRLSEKELTDLKNIDLSKWSASKRVSTTSDNTAWEGPQNSSKLQKRSRNKSKYKEKF